MLKIIDGKLMAEALNAACNLLIIKKDEVNSLNVFPVPDGDTGTNMSLTMRSALKQVNELDEGANISEIAKSASRGALMGARGNSGVILSQFLRGFAESLSGKVTANSIDIANAFKKASETTYNAVMKPTEGTILTVGREASDFAIRNARKYESLVDFLEEIVKEAKKSLDKTPELLPVLKEAGVVDAGGMGLVVLLEGALKSLKGEKIESTEDETLKSKAPKTVVLNVEDDSIEFGYCTEFIITTDYEDLESFKNILSSYGDSLLVVGGYGSGVIKVHVHTNNPGKVLEEGLKLGYLQDIKIDNMRIQHSEILFNESEVAKAKKEEEKKAEKELKDYSFVVVSIGEGLNEIFKSLNVDGIVAGGQTMNPSTEDLLNAVEETDGKNVFILPNNSNIILAAEQVQALTDRNIIVVPTKTIPQGISSLLSFSYNSDVEENTKAMLEGIGHVKSAQVTYAVRSTQMNGIDISEGDIIGLSGKEIIAAGNSVNDVTLELIDSLIDDESSLISLYYGEDVTEEEAEKINAVLEEKYADIDIQTVYGGQPLYYYIVSVE